MPKEFDAVQYRKFLDHVIDGAMTIQEGLYRSLIPDEDTVVKSIAELIDFR